MGIYDRDYYRRERSGILSVFDGTGQVCITILVITVVAYFVQIGTREWISKFEPIQNSGWFTNLFDFQPAAIFHGQVWRLVTYAFLHSTDSIWHIVFNMLLFWMVGRETESIYGPREFLAFYLVAALIGGLAQLLAGWMVPQLAGPMLGASGAVTAVLVLFAMHFPTRVFYFMMVIPMPVIALVAVSVLIDVLGLVSGQAKGVAVACHLGGAAFGFLYYRFDWRVTRFWPSLPNLKKMTRRQPRLRVFRGEDDEEPVGVHSPTRPSPESQLEAELDTVLEKVSRYGKSSLTDREQQILLRASEIYRNKRK